MLASSKTIVRGSTVNFYFAHAILWHAALAMIIILSKYSTYLCIYMENYDYKLYPATIQSVLLYLKFY